MADEAQTSVPLATEDSPLTSEADESLAASADSSIPTEKIDVEDYQGPSSTGTSQAASSASVGEQRTSTTQLAEIHETLLALRRDFESKLMYDAGKQRQLDTLHEELEAYRRGFHFQILRPVITDLIALYTDMDKVASRLYNHQAHSETAQEVMQFRDQVEEILRRNGVEPYTSQTDEFDAKRQRAISTVDTTNKTNDKRVAVRLRPGFEYEGKIVVQPEQVQTYRYIAPVDTGE